MSKNISLLDVTKVNENQLPSIISTQFDKLTELENNVQKAVNMAVTAKEKAEEAKVSAGWFKKKAAIKALQDAAEGSADALITMAEAQKLSFEYQTKLTEITKYLFGLGVSNIAMNRSVVRELELRLKGASEDDISELAQQELKNVILQLKSQEDIMKKQEFLTGKVKEQAGQILEIDRQIDNMEATDDAQDEKIEENAEKIFENARNIIELEEKDKEQDAQIAKNAQGLDILEQQDEKHDRRLDEGEQKDKEQDALISENAQDIDELERQDAEQDRRLDEGDKKDAEQDAQISENAQDIDELERQDEEQDRLISKVIEKDKEQDRIIEQIQDTDEEQNEILAQQQEKIDLLQNKIENLESMLSTKGNKTLLIATTAASAVALIISILQFFI